ncbi:MULTISPECIES: hypothetical protein [Francisella]|uniref:hypothetical protein n=1 Tax=Francisella TaxID=262 RepID=UPI0009095091|nr:MULTISPECIES: hypothetical protein [Francisella]APC92127.1 hypothetical protein BBG19_1399 [Francisella sp. MA067296]
MDVKSVFVTYEIADAVANTAKPNISTDVREEPFSLGFNLIVYTLFKLEQLW